MLEVLEDRTVMATLPVAVVDAPIAIVPLSEISAALAA